MADCRLENIVLLIMVAPFLNFPAWPN